MQYKLNDFNFYIPSDLIAQKPLKCRDKSRLIIRYSDTHIEHSFFYNLVNVLPSQTLLVLNDSKVIPCRIFGHLKSDLSDKAIEIFLMEDITDFYSVTLNYNKTEFSYWKILANPLRKLKINSFLFFEQNLDGEICEINNSHGYAILKFNKTTNHILEWLNINGYVPLPPYIKRTNLKPAINSQDKYTYQTVYARNEGSSAAPTAGLHFTQNLLNKLQQKGIEIIYITLHVGGGTFLPVRVLNLDEHNMHSEKYFITKSNLNKIIEAKRKGYKIINVGTTTLRCLESLSIIANYDIHKMINYADKWLTTNLFIKPSQKQPIYNPFFCDALITNFHQPKSTLFILISALFGLENMKKLYQIAIEQKYRFFSYGDACLLWKNP